MDFVKETLEWVNRERAALGFGGPLDDLPKGITGECKHCPIARALGYDAEVSSVEVFYYGYPEGDIVVELPECAVQFVRAFDDGDLPEYDENA